MNNLKSAFIEMAIQHNVLSFGQFILKSGRVSPYFFNLGLFYHGSVLKKLGCFYAQTLKNNNIEFEHLFGPAYKGFALATATAIALTALQVDCTVTFNRKESKKHGEGGMLIGGPITGRAVIIDDVVSAGTAFREVQKLINDAGGNIVAMIVALDRCERGLNSLSGLHEIAAQGIQIMSLITVFDLLEYLKNNDDINNMKQIENYLATYGC